ncbi:hypothetical protein SCHRY_v1c05680 [Spiroplasma chrysopicola DF-1]|uniref:Uncharacterized protein n=2 Tax=Spiroplasma chrysopicola TaxID=216933 RepID=R4UIM4_9MOLU|nr:hypothetical protein SCHRY_v1c05680 [Spiroplasma chrysopicola DF-1]
MVLALDINQINKERENFYKKFEITDENIEDFNYFALQLVTNIDFFIIPDPPVYSIGKDFFAIPDPNLGMVCILRKNCSLIFEKNKCV